MEEQENNKGTTINKTTIINNVSVKKNPFSTLLGGLFVLVGLGAIILEMLISLGLVKTISSPTELFPQWVAWALIGLGIILIFIPDTLFGGLKKLVDKKADQL